MGRPTVLSCLALALLLCAALPSRAAAQSTSEKQLKLEAYNAWELPFAVAVTISQITTHSERVMETPLIGIAMAVIMAVRCAIAMIRSCGGGGGGGW